MTKRSLELGARSGVTLGGLLTWAFLFNSTPYFPGYRALQTNGIDLPVLSAFRLLGALNGTRLAVVSSQSHTLDDVIDNSVRGQADIDAMATQNGRAIQVLVWNYHDDMVAAPGSPVHLSVKVPAAFGTRGRVSHLRVDETHGDAYTVWVSQGKPANPSPAQIAALQEAMVPSLAAPEAVLEVAAGTIELDFVLPRFGVSLITMSPANDADASTEDAGTADVALQDASAHGSTSGEDAAADAVVNGANTGGASVGPGSDAGSTGTSSNETGEGGAGTGVSGGAGNTGNGGSNGAGTGVALRGSGANGMANTASSGAGQMDAASAGGSSPDLQESAGCACHVGRGRPSDSGSRRSRWAAAAILVFAAVTRNRKTSSKRRSLIRRNEKDE